MKMNIQNTDYDELIKTSFQGFYNNPRFSDVTMITDDFEAIQGHKLILSQASPLLDKLMMINSPGWRVLGPSMEERGKPVRRKPTQLRTLPPLRKKPPLQL